MNLILPPRVGSRVHVRIVRRRRPYIGVGIVKKIISTGGEGRRGRDIYWIEVETKIAGASREWVFAFADELKVVEK